jgi:hypothetical protein
MENRIKGRALNLIVIVREKFCRKQTASGG